MSAADLTQVILYVVIVTAIYAFIFRGRKLGYKALASRTTELRQKGIDVVYLLRSNQHVGVSYSNSASIWSLLNTGYLGYIENGSFVIEFPWWHKAHQVHSVTPAITTAQFIPHTGTLWFNVPGILIDGWKFTVVGTNISDVNNTKRAIKRKGLNKQQLEAYRAQLAAELAGAGFVITQ
jgi:hypothetical protein